MLIFKFYYEDSQVCHEIGGAISDIACPRVMTGELLARYVVNR